MPATAPHLGTAMFTVQRSTETMQQSVLGSTWCDKNKATPFEFEVTRNYYSSRLRSFLTACRKEILVSVKKQFFSARLGHAIQWQKLLSTP